MTSVLKFQEHRRRSLPTVLGGLGISEKKGKDVEGSEEQIPNPEKHQEGGSGKNPEAEEETKDPSKEHSQDMEVKNTDPLETQNPEIETKTSDPPKKQDSFITPGKAAKQIG
jgi:hypothetical protein